MKIKYVKHLLSFFLVFLILFSFSVPAFAEEIPLTDFTIMLKREVTDGHTTTSTNYPFTIDTYSGNASLYSIRPVDTSFWDLGGEKICVAFNVPGLIAGHEYSLDFQIGTNFSTHPTLKVLVGSERVYEESLPGYYSKVSINFKAPDVVTASTQISIILSVNSAESFKGAFLISKNIEFEDLTVNPSWLQGLSDTINSFYLDCVTELLNIQQYIVLFNSDMVTRFDNLLSRFDIKLSDFLSVIQNEFTNLKNNLNTNFSSLISSLNTQFSNLISNLNSGFSVTNSNIISFQNDFNTLIDNLHNSLNSEFEYINNFLEENFNYESGSDDIMSEGQTSVDDLNNGASEADEAVPSINESDLNSALNQEGVTSFISDLTNSFMFFEMLYENVISALNIETLVFFCLSFGIAIYIIGRRLGVG